MDTVLAIVFLLLIASLALAFVRLARGPSLPDRVVALDLIGTIFASIAAVSVVASGQPMFLDIATVLAVVGFFGTVAVARYLERNPTDD